VPEREQVPFVMLLRDDRTGVWVPHEIQRRHLNIKPNGDYFKHGKIEITRCGIYRLGKVDRNGFHARVIFGQYCSNALFAPAMSLTGSRWAVAPFPPAEEPFFFATRNGIAMTATFQNTYHHDDIDCGNDAGLQAKANAAV
jgi:hypothetical protein